MFWGLQGSRSVGWLHARAGGRLAEERPQGAGQDGLPRSWRVAGGSRQHLLRCRTHQLSRKHPPDRAAGRLV